MVSMEEDEEYEMLEVQEEEETTTAQGKMSSAASDGESPSKSSGSNETTPEKEEKPLIKLQTKSNAANQRKSSSPAADEKKLLNSLAPSSRPVSNATSNSTSTSNASAAAAVAALHKKGITMKKTSSSVASSGGTPRIGQSTSNSGQQKNSTIRVAGQVLGVGESIPLPESIKRKLVETQPGAQPAKKPNTNNSIATSSSAQSMTTISTTNVRSTSTVSIANTSASLQESSLALNNVPTINIKQEPNDGTNQPTGINLITITGNPRVELTNGGGGGPSSSTAATVASTSTNGYSPRLEDIDFRNDIIFDSGNGPINGAVGGAVNHSNHTNAPGGIINLGNFDNSLPPTFFKNLCNSSRHEALGLYVANVMNRLRPRSAQKLELGILRAIIDVQSDELEQ